VKFPIEIHVGDSFVESEVHQAIVIK